MLSLCWANAGTDFVGKIFKVSVCVSGGCGMAADGTVGRSEFEDRLAHFLGERYEAPVVLDCSEAVVVADWSSGVIS